MAGRSVTGAPLIVAAIGLAASFGADASAQARDTVVISLADAEELALRAAPTLAGARADIDLAEAQRTRASNARFLPEFNLRNVWGPIPRQRGEFNAAGVLFSPDTALGAGDLRWFTQLDLQMVQPLLTFGKAGSRIDAARHAVGVAEAGLDGAQSEALFLVRRLYSGVVLGNELRRVADNLMSEVDEAEETLNEQYEEGDATQNDVFKFELFKYEVGRRSRELDATIELAREGLRAAVGLPSGTPIRVATTQLTADEVTLEPLSIYLREARQHRPELRQLSSGIEARKSLIRAEQRDGWPTLFVAGGLRMNVAPDRFDPRNPFWRNDTNYFRPNILVGLDWELNFLGHRDQARAQRFELVKLESQYDPLVALVEQEVREAYLRAERARADVEAGDDALQASENWLRAELQTYDIGIGEIKDVIDAFQANVSMETEQLQNIAAFNEAVAEINRRVGRDVTSGGGA